MNLANLISVAKRRVLLAVGVAGAFALPAAGQEALTDPPVPSAGAYAATPFSLSQIESINPVTGVVSLGIPIAHLPPGPAGFGAGVTLVYNSDVYDDQTIPCESAGGTATCPTVTNISERTYYVQSAHGGGWNYGFRYTLSTVPRLPYGFTLSNCNDFSANEKAAWFKNYLRTPDGNNHVLNLVNTLLPGGSPGPSPSTLAHDLNNAYWLYDYKGDTNTVCFSGTPFTGTLIFATSDSSYIRVEATITASNPAVGSWTAYLPDGTQVSGNLSGNPAFDNDSSQITDRNGNTVLITGSCVESTACTETICYVGTNCNGNASHDKLDPRGIVINYNSPTQGSPCVNPNPTCTPWIDTITWPGINGRLTSTVNWDDVYESGNLPFYCYFLNNNGSFSTLTGDSSTQCTTGPVFVVNSVQLPPDNNGNSANFIMNYAKTPPGAWQGSPPPYLNNAWGELHYLQMCAGVSPANCQREWMVNYTYLFDTVTSVPIPPTGQTIVRPAGTPLNPIYNKTLQYTEKRDGSNPTNISETTSFSVPMQTSAFVYPITGPSTITYPDGSQKQIFTKNLCASLTSRDFCPPVTYKVTNPDGSLTETAWATNPIPSNTGIPPGAIFNPFVQWTVTTPAGLSFSRGAQVAQDQNGNATSLQEFDWTAYSALVRNADGSLASMPGTAPRTTAATYYANNFPSQAYFTHGAPTFLKAKQNATVNPCPAQSPCAKYTYDNPLTTANLQQTQLYDTAQSAYITSSATYLSNGNVATQKDANGVMTLTCYDSNSLYPVKRVVGATSATCPTPTTGTVSRTFAFAPDPTTGLLISETDVDNAVTTSYNRDNLGRETSATQTASSLIRTATTTYDDVNLVVTTTQDGTPSPQLTTSTTYDALGRVAFVTDGVGNRAQKAYRFGTGGVSYVLESNPYVSTSDATMGWTLTTSTASPPIITVQHYSTSNLPAPWGNNASRTGTVTTANAQGGVGCTSTTTTKLTDEAGNSHIYCYDGLGRMNAVIEPNPVNGSLDPSAASNPAMTTCYTYDLFNNLTGVAPGAQPSATPCSSATPTRTFSYSTLSRLLSGTNPESGTTSYQYDNNGNVLSLTDARGTVTAMTYDVLNRLNTKTYTPAGGATATANVTLKYDQGGFIGTLSSVSLSDNSSSTTYTYDALGRVNASTQKTGGTPYGFVYLYSLRDQLTQMTYPSGRTVKYTLDAIDRVTSVQNGATGSNYYVSNVTYTAPGGMATMTTGNQVTQAVSWNDRAQPTNLQVTGPSNPPSNPLLNLGFFPCASQAASCASGNNGNLQSQTIAAPSFGPVTQTYSYDTLNRLTAATESGSPGWTQNYGFDVFGNRWVSTNTNLPALTLETPIAQSWYSSTVPNRINSWSYDAAGNLLQVGGMTRSFTYDAEDRQASATINSNTSTYAYDGLGERVMKTTGGNTTVYVYDAFGHLAAEYSSQPAASPCGTPTCYLALDHLGSTRLLTDANGSSTVARYDYLPFGGELLASTNGRTTGMGYFSNADATNPKFTGQVRDPETYDANGKTALDWFIARAMSGAQGRFQSVDPGNAGADPTNPQTWNGYAYVANNPLSYTDPSGKMIATAEGATIGASVGGPFGAAAGAIIGSIIDLGALFAGLFGFGGGSAPFFTDSGPLPGGGATGGGAWSEQIPYNLGGGGLNTGSVYGSGDTGPFINNILRVDGPDAKLGSNYKFYAEAIAYLQSDPRMAAIIFQLQQSRRAYVVTFNRGGGNDAGINWDPLHSVYTTNGGCLSPAAGLAHELAHAAAADSDPAAYAGRSGTFDPRYDTLEEKRVITGVEASVQRMLGGLPRFDHGRDETKGIRGLEPTPGRSPVLAGCR